MSSLTQFIKGIKMIWMLGCLIISTFIQHGDGSCSLGTNTRIYYGNEAVPRKYFINIHTQCVEEKSTESVEDMDGTFAGW